MKNTHKHSVVFNGEICYLERFTYDGGNTGLCMVDEDGLPYMTVSINVPDCPLPSGTFVIKDYSENSGILSVLEKAGIIENMGINVRTGFVEAPICRLLVDSFHYE